MCVYFSVTLHQTQHEIEAMSNDGDQLARSKELAQAPGEIVEAEPANHL